MLGNRSNSCLLLPTPQYYSCEVQHQLYLLLLLLYRYYERRDGRTCLVRPNSQSRTKAGKQYFPCSADRTGRTGNNSHPVDPYSAISHHQSLHSAESAERTHSYTTRTVLYYSTVNRARSNFLYCVMYSHTYSKSMDQPGKIANPVRGQLNRKNEYFPVRVRA